jgi:hypothetical protein
MLICARFRLSKAEEKPEVIFFIAAGVKYFFSTLSLETG